MVFCDGTEVGEVENERPLSAGGGAAAEQRQGLSQAFGGQGAGMG